MNVSETQSKVLLNAFHAKGSVLPLPAGIVGGVAKNVLAAMLRREWIQVLSGSIEDAVFTDSNKEPDADTIILNVRLTDTGERVAESLLPPTSNSGFRAGSKLDMIHKLLSREMGVSLDELITVTGWQQHTVRGQLSNLKKTGIPVDSYLVDGVRTFRIS
jgi:hypothetical protein